MSGPDTLKVGQEGIWRGEATGGAGHTHQWIVEFKGNRIVRPEKDGGITTIPATPKQPGTMTLTLLVWDNTTPKAAAKRAVKVVQVQPVAAAPTRRTGASAVEGWWVGEIREREDPKRPELIPLHIRRENDGTYTGNLMASLTVRGIPERGTPPWKFRRATPKQAATLQANYPQ